ncbi:MAG TPA: DUF2252 domain-containing protein [Solirubrobacteraceae bacterium]
MTPYLTVAERVAKGKAARREVPRSTHGVYQPPSDRPSPVDLLERQARARLPHLVPIRYGRMLVSPFTFYRGAALIMASDLSATPRSGLTVQCCGDAHLSNFGAFASPERRLVFDINDFDETHPGPWEWDLKRLSTSVLIAARDNGFRRKDQDEIVLQTVREYRAALATFAGMGNLDVWYASVDLDRFVAEHEQEAQRRVVKRTKAILAKARTRDSMSAFSKLARQVDGRVEIVSDPPLILPMEDYTAIPRAEGIDLLSNLLRQYRASLEPDRRSLLEQYEIEDFALKVVGVGSVGTRAFIALLMGRDGRDPLFLQAKEAEASVFEEFVGRSRFRNHGQRVVTGQRLMQASSDIFLGWVTNKEGIDGRPHDYYLRQLRDWKGSVPIEEMLTQGMTAYGRLCGWTLARAHARTGDRVAISAYLGKSDVFDRAILEFSKVYAEQNEQDYAELRAAVESGRIVAETGV